MRRIKRLILLDEAHLFFKESTIKNQNDVFKKMKETIQK
jgi:hypothetical protein